MINILTHRPRPARWMALATAAAILTTLSAPAAHAAGATAPPTISGSIGGSGTGSSGGGAGMPRTPSKPTPPAPTQPGTRWITITQPLTGATGKINGLAVTCPVKADGRKATAATLRGLYTLGGSITAPPLTYTVTCSYPAAPVERLITCPVAVDGTLSGPTGAGVTSTPVTTTVKRISEWAAADRRGTTCAEDLGASLARSIGTGSMGQWSLALRYTQQSCTVLDYTGSQPDVIKGCGPEQNATLQRWLTVSCNLPAPGWVMAKVDVAGGFGPTSCGGSEPPQTGEASWSCTPAAVTYDGIAAGPGARAQVLDDGRHREARWGQTTVDGVRNARVIGTRWTVDPDSTPLRSRGQAPADEQPMTIRTSKTGSNAALAGRTAGDASLWVAYYDAGLPGKSSVIHRSVTIAGEYPVTQARITGVDLLTGQMTVETNTAWVSGVGSCGSQDLSVDVYRARISN